MKWNARLLQLLKIAPCLTTLLIPTASSKQPVMIPPKANSSITSSFTSEKFIDNNSSIHSATSSNLSINSFLAVDMVDSVSTTEHVKEGSQPLLKDEIEQAKGNYSEQLECASTIRKFDNRLHMQRYHIYVHAIRGFDAAFDEYNLTFAEYLTATAGRRFDPPIEFEMIPVTFQGLFDAVDSMEADFFYANPGIYSCVGVEQGAQPLATIISHLSVRGHTYDLDVFGGVIFTRADNDDINTVNDLKDKIIGAGGISMIMAGQLQFYEMEMAGMSYVMDPKQVVFTYNQFEVVNGVLDGQFDVGFVRTDTIERTKDKDGNPINPDLLKIIRPQIYVLDDGRIFPFLHSTDIYPEWPVSALTHIPRDVAEEVQEALFALEVHSKAGQLLHGCEDHEEDCTDESFLRTRCDTTNELAELAYRATKKGKLTGFRPPRSYFEVRTMQEAAGFLRKDEKGKWKCTRASTLYDGIDCPAEHYKLSKEDFQLSCGNVGLNCTEGYECFCKPCVKAFEMDVFQVLTQNSEDEDEGNLNLISLVQQEYQGCEKMSLCGTVEQTKTIIFRAIDNKQRENAKVSAVMHLGQSTTELAVNKVKIEDEKKYAYEFTWSEKSLGVGILEVYVDDEQIPESPIRVQVVERNCNAEFPRDNKKADANGICICNVGTVDFAGKCISFTIIAIVVSVAAILIAAEIGYLYLRYKNHKNDQMWMVSVEELHFDDPAEVVGQGSFGVVLLAEYRGTKVAIKRALKTPKGRSPTRSTSKGHSKKETVNTKSAALNDSSDDTGTHYSDIECPTDDHIMTNSKQGSCMSTDENFSLDFLSTDLDQNSKWSWLFPWATQNDYQSRVFKETILSSSGSLSTKSLTARLLPWCDETTRRQEEFLREMRLLSRLRHPCITTVMGAVVTRSHDPMLVMEYMEYGSLYDLLRNETMILNGDLILQITRDIAQGMRYLHSSKPPILHGDVKARNILIDARFRAKVCDFGLASKTKNIITGTPYWLAPEYLRGQTNFNAKCDMYSVGVVLYEIYSRSIPYQGENFKEVLRKVCDRRVNKRPKIPPTCPPKMVELMKKCWSPDPIARLEAKELDTTLMGMSSVDVDPLSEENQIEKTRTQDMLYELFPKHIADALKNGQKVEPESHDLVTVVFSDIVHFTDISREISPLKVSNMLDRLYLAFDKIARKHGVFKVETIGDAYMGVTNLEANQNSSHVSRVAEFAVDMISEANKIVIDEEDPSRGRINIRVGFHSGPVVSNVIGSLNPRYGLFGDTVNTASRMESNSKANRILCSEKSYHLLKIQAPEFPTKKRGKVHVKGKGDMCVYWVGDGLISSNVMNDEPPTEQVEIVVAKQVGFTEDDISNSHPDQPVAVANAENELGYL